MDAIVLNQLVKRYGEQVVVDHLSLTIKKGECLALLGPNGAGKTTTIKMLCGLIEPTAGTIQINGQPVHKRHLTMPSIGVVLEGARNVYWRMSAWENLRYFANLKGLRINAAVKKHMEQLLTDLDLWERRHDEVRTFSRGMQQKVAVACALITNPEIVLLDEPTLGLDVQAYQTIVQFVRELANSGKTLLLTSHDFRFISDVAQRVVVMQQKLIFDGWVSELAALHGGHYEVRVTDFPQTAKSDFPQWRIRQDGAETILIGDADLYGTIQRLGSLGATLVSVEQVALSADVFLELLNTGKSAEL